MANEQNLHGIKDNDVENDPRDNQQTSGPAGVSRQDQSQKRGSQQRGIKEGVRRQNQHGGNTDDSDLTHKGHFEDDARPGADKQR